jgi:hypothetical protein
MVEQNLRKASDQSPWHDRYDKRLNTFPSLPRPAGSRRRGHHDGIRFGQPAPRIRKSSKWLEIEEIIGKDITEQQIAQRDPIIEKAGNNKPMRRRRPKAMVAARADCCL